MLPSLKRFVCGYKGYKNLSTISCCIEKLSSKSLIRVAGEKSSEFLQGLITNDMRHIEDGAPSIFAVFLNTKGRILYDSIIYGTKEKTVFLVECDSNILNDLVRHLKMYTVRRKISVDHVSDQLCVWVMVKKELADLSVQKESINIETKNASVAESNVLQDLLVVADPRTGALGNRIIAEADVPIDKVLEKKGYSVVSSNFYQRLRYHLGIGEGSTELPTGQSFPLEANCDYLHGVSFHKGCYIGQEVTARTHHTGVVRKRYMPIFLKESAIDLAYDFPIAAADKTVGKLRGFSENVGIGLLRVEEALSADCLKIGDLQCSTQRPKWWPAQAPKKI